MTATLADDTILVSHFRANATDIENPIVPKGGGDLGDRMILAPQEINPDYTTDEIKVPNRENCATAQCRCDRAFFRARSKNYWAESAHQILDKDNIHGPALLNYAIIMSG